MKFGNSSKPRPSYAFPELGYLECFLFRFFGCGLGNTLFPWARCEVACKKYGLIPLEPTWLSLKPKTLIKRALGLTKQDARSYHDFFHPGKNTLKGWIRPWMYFFKPRVDQWTLYKEDRAREGVLYIIRTHAYLFRDIMRDHDFIWERLIAMTREEHKSGLSCQFEPGIFVHVRRGDFRVPQSGDDLSKDSWCYRVPDEWFMEKIEQIREYAGRDCPVYLFSDGSDHELREILSLPNTRRMNFGSAIADLLALCRASVLIGSGSSTFSMWASFLGRMPVVWYQGQLKQHLYYEKPDAEIESGIGEEIPQGFIEHLKRALHPA